MTAAEQNEMLLARRAASEDVRKRGRAEQAIVALSPAELREVLVRALLMLADRRPA